MTVQHPLADRDAPTPAAVTVGTTTYPVDDDGVIDCPDDAVEDVKEAFGADEEKNETTREHLIASVESGTVDDVAALIERGDFDGMLDELAEVEAQQGGDRKGVHAAIEDRRDAVQEE